MRDKHVTEPFQSRNRESYLFKFATKRASGFAP